ncbi:hypothetical protein ACH0BF_16755 [Pseudobacillus sp. 179-B 2D1 NHS]|uniref:hypothetical protein n=1 Tax=Pseudobacillus sp. 179-B 2D1 NHS TaxID=3374292 RepID=UPI0038792708
MARSGLKRDRRRMAIRNGIITFLSAILLFAIVLTLTANSSNSPKDQKQTTNRTTIDSGKEETVYSQEEYEKIIEDWKEQSAQTDNQYTMQPSDDDEVTEDDLRSNDSSNPKENNSDTHESSSENVESETGSEKDKKPVSPNKPNEKPNLSKPDNKKPATYDDSNADSRNKDQKWFKDLRDDIDEHIEDSEINIEEPEYSSEFDKK